MGLFSLIISLIILHMLIQAMHLLGFLERYFVWCSVSGKESMIRIGVAAVQGAVSEHIQASEKALEMLGLEGKAYSIRRGEQVEEIDCLILPGGESTAISRLLVKFGMFDKIRDRALKGMPIMGTCAGLVLLSKFGDEEVEKTNTKLLGLMDCAVNRNAFGRQKESFEMDISLVLEGTPTKYHAVFIRAPVITKVYADCKVLAELPEGIVAAKQGNVFVFSFHPELTEDYRIHAWFIKTAVQK